MKNSIYKFFLIALTFTTFSCSDSSNHIIDVLLDTYTTGAFIRTLDIISDELDLNDTSSFMEIVVEEQDEEFGGLLESLEIMITFVDRSDPDNNTVEVLGRTYLPSDFTTNPDSGLPMTTLMFTYDELLNITGADQSIIAHNDQMDLRLVLNLTDGRSFTNTDVNGNVSAGLFFQAAMFFSIKIKD